MSAAYPGAPLDVLVVCRHNPSRSQMAELGVDLGQARPRPVTEDLVARARRIVLLGDQVRETAPPFLLATPHEEWDLADPKGQGLAVVCGIRDALRPRVEALVQHLER